MLTRIGNKVTVGRPLCNVLRIGRPLEGGGSFLRDWTVYGKSEVVGSSVLGVGDEYPWNQLVFNPSFADSLNGWSVEVYRSVEVTNGAAKVTMTAVSGNNGLLSTAISFAAGHKYLLSVNVKDYSLNPSSAVVLKVSGQAAATEVTSNTAGEMVKIFTLASDTSARVNISNRATGNIGDSFTITAPHLIDLTAIFGSGNEPSTVDEFKAWLVKVGKMAKVTDDIPYFPYDAGSTFTSLPIVASSRNLWDEECELGSISIATGALVPSTTSIRSKNFCEITGNTVALCNASGIYSSNRIIMVLYDKDKQLVDFWAFNATFPVRIINIVSGAKYFKLSFDTAYGSTYNHDICINISDALNGTYTPHQSQRFPLVISSPLHGIGDVRDIMRYSLHGITRKYGVAKLKDLTWGYTPFYTTGRPDFYATLPNAKTPASVNEKANVLLAGYTTMAAQQYVGNTTGVACVGGTGRLAIRDTNYTDAASFKAHFTDDDILVYELATPTFEPVTLPKLPAYRDGTVLYTDTQVHGDTIAGEAPVGFSLLPPVTMTPPTGDGDTNGQTDDTATE